MRKNSGFQFEQKIKSELALWGITPDGHELLVGLSGGPDSICLVHVCLLYTSCLKAKDLSNI